MELSFETRLKQSKITVWHGSKAKFDAFNFDNIGQNGTSEGKGIYFTDNQKIAEGYADKGYLYTVELDISKPFILNKKSLTKDDLRKLFLHLHSLDSYHLSNYGDVEWEGLEKVLNEAIELTFNDDCDVEMISGIANTIGSAEVMNRAVYDALGYSSIICDAEWGNQTIYIALVTDIINIKSCEKR